MRILLGRTRFGFGDWIMFATVVNIINHQYPDALVDIDITEIPPGEMWKVEMLFQFGCRCRMVNRPVRSEYDGYVNHVVYDRHRGPGHLIQLMCDVVSRATPLAGLHYEPRYLANYQGNWIRSFPDIMKAVYPRHPDETVLMPSVGNKGKAIKDPGHGDTGWWQELASLISRHWPVVQIGSRLDPVLAVAKHRIADAQVPVIASCMRMCRFAILIENGLAHFAGHHSIPAYVIYTDTTHARPSNLVYPNQVPLDYEGLNPTPAEIFDRIMAREQNTTKPTGNIIVL